MSILVGIYQTLFGSQALLKEALKQIAVLQAQNQHIIDLLTPGPAVTFKFTATRPDGTIEENSIMQTFRDDQKITLTITPLDKKGNPAAIDGVPTWASADATIAAVNVSADGLSAEVVGVAPGTTRVTATGDADLGEAVQPFTGIEDIVITGGGAVTFAFTATAPVDQ